MSSLKPSHIACLEDETAQLYAEVIQVITDRQCCWARPIALVQSLSSEPFSLPGHQADLGGIEAVRIHDLREGADLLLPLSLFRVALDTEVIPLLMRLEVPKAEIGSDRKVHQLLQAFVHQLCKTHPDAFA
ncbi:MAG: hypothetical protein IGR76_03460 [Synechococcales cyanobacterium T60_A2020_003]|nr:hypothetical protein [Synechococcales cyanobacterium T60_A2020_003]